MRSFAIGDGDDRHLDAEVLHALQQPSRSEHLVVGVGRDDHKAAGQVIRSDGRVGRRLDPSHVRSSVPGMHLVDD